MKPFWHSPCHPSYFPGRVVEFRSGLSTYEKEDGIKHHWQIQEEIQRVNSKNKKLIFVFAAIFLWNSWMMTGRFSRSNFSCWHNHVHVLQSGEVTKMNVLCISRANTENSPKEIKRLSKELVHIDIAWLWLPTSDCPGEKGPGVRQVESQRVMFYAVTMTDFVFWSIFHI